MKNREVAEQFLNGYEVKGSNLFSEKNNGKKVLFSWGYHFPLCVMLEDGKKLFNEEGYSQSTKVHRTYLAWGLGFYDWRDMVEKDKTLILLSSDELNKIIRDETINSEADFLARNL